MIVIIRNDLSVYKSIFVIIFKWLMRIKPCDHAAFLEGIKPELFLKPKLSTAWDRLYEQHIQRN